MPADPKPKDSHWNGIFSERVSGIGMLIGTAIEGYVIILTPLLQATYHAPKIDCYFKFVIVVMVLFSLGLIFAIFGKRASRALLQSPKKLSTTGSVVMAVLIQLGIQISHWMQSFLEEYGYAITKHTSLVDVFTRSVL